MGDMELGQPVIEVEDVSFRYAERGDVLPVLEDVSLTVAANDFLGIIGPNGGGKTTLLKVILGLLCPQTGNVRVFGQTPRKARNRIGYVPQHAQIDFSVPANVMDMVLMGRLGHSQWGFRFSRTDREAVRRALHDTGSEDLAERPVHHLSGGQFNRVLIARALAAEAELLLLDEPKTGMDPEAEKGLTELLHRLNQRLPIVLVSHDIGFVSAHLKRVACLNRRITSHSAAELTSEAIAGVYHRHVQAVHHKEACPVTYLSREESSENA